MSILEGLIKDGGSRAAPAPFRAAPSPQLQQFFSPAEEDLHGQLQQFFPTPLPSFRRPIGPSPLDNLISSLFGGQQGSGNGIDGGGGFGSEFAPEGPPAGRFGRIMHALLSLGLPAPVGLVTLAARIGEALRDKGGVEAFGQEGSFGFDLPGALESFDEPFGDIGFDGGFGDFGDEIDGDGFDGNGAGAGQGDPSGEPGEPDE